MNYFTSATPPQTGNPLEDVKAAIAKITAMKGKGGLGNTRFVVFDVHSGGFFTMPKVEFKPEIQPISVSGTHGMMFDTKVLFPDSRIKIMEPDPEIILARGMTLAQLVDERVRWRRHHIVKRKCHKPWKIDRIKIG
jgi:hypothetical protein